MAARPDPPHRTVSADGTPIAWWSSGAGPPLLLVHGAMSDHRRWRLLPYLEPHVTVHAMDRRGRGGSGDSPQWSLGREVEDVVAVVEAVAGECGSLVDVLGHSLGGLLALRAAGATPSVGRVVVYEPAVDEPAAPTEVLATIESHLARGDRAEAVRTLMRELVLMPQAEIDYLESLPSWPTRLAAAHTLPRELGVDLVMTPHELSRIPVPVLSLLGADSPAGVQAAARTLAGSVPDHRLVVLEGQQHVADQVVPGVFAQHVLDFLVGERP